MPSVIDPALQLTMAESNDKKRPHADGDESPRKSKKTKSTFKSDEFIKDEDEEAVDLAVRVRKEKKDKGKKDKKDKDKKDKKEKKDKSEKEKKKEKKDKKEKKVSKEKRDAKSSTEPTLPTPALFDISSDAPPFYTQTVSLWLPLYPVGFDRPITSAAHQHLDGLIDHYSPLLGGYLLAYRNVNLSENSVRADPKNPPTDATPATLTSVDEYAVGFGWLTVDVDLFVPRRGAWLEGTVILQNEGAIGVNCWEKFNASIEAARLPRGWQYVELDQSHVREHVEDPETDQSMIDADAADAQINAEASGDAIVAGDADLLQSTGYWTDETGRPVEGTLRFRIKDFDVGLAGDNGYLAIEGTLLGAADEILLKHHERQRLRGNTANSSVARGKTRRLNEFSITQFGREEEDEESGRRVELYKGSRPGTPA